MGVGNYLKKTRKIKKKIGCLLVFIITYFHIHLLFTKSFGEDSVGPGSEDPMD